MHPSAILKGSWGDEPYQIVYLKRAAQVLRGMTPLIPDFTKHAPDTNPFPTLAELHEWGKGIGPQGVVLDIENAGTAVIMIGFTRVDDLHSVQVWFRRGPESWTHCPECRGIDNEFGCAHPRDDFAGVVRWVADLLADPRIPKCAHNGQSHDWIYLARVGFVINHIDFDTLLACHIRMPEARKRLETNAAALLGISGWKAQLHQRKDDEDEEGAFK